MNFVVYAPPYNHASGGCRALYRLNSDLILSGHQSRIVVFRTTCHISDDTIVIYPEVTHGNPLGAKKVVRYILNVPGKLGGDKMYPPSEMLVAYNGALTQYSNGEMLTTPILENFFKYDGREKTIPAIFWVGKGTKNNNPICDITKGLPEITYTSPATREQLADIMKQTRVVYTYDDFTGIADEALYAGCKVVLIDHGVEKDYNFISYTQNYKGLTIDWYQVQLKRFLERCANL